MKIQTDLRATLLGRRLQVACDGRAGWRAFCLLPQSRRLLGTFKQFLRVKQLLVKFSRAARFHAKTERGISKTVPDGHQPAVTHASSTLSETPCVCSTRAAGHLRPTKAWRGTCLFSPHQTRPA